MLSTTLVRLRGSFFDFARPKTRKKEKKREKKEDTYTWECLIENYSVECILASDDCAPAAKVVGLSFGVHVRLARVSCGATLPIPGCLRDCNIVSGRGTVDGRGWRGERKRERKRGSTAITIRSRLLVWRILSLVLNPHLAPSFSLSIRLPMYNLCSSNGVLWR